MKRNEFCKKYFELRGVGNSTSRTDRELDTEEIGRVENYFRSTGKVDFDESDLDTCAHQSIMSSRPLSSEDIEEKVNYLTDPISNPKKYQLINKATQAVMGEYFNEIEADEEADSIGLDLVEVIEVDV